MNIQPHGIRSSTSPRSGRQNLAQGEASAASETLGSRPLKNLARFSGRKTFLSPAKAGSKNVRNRNPGLRFACPRLNSAVPSADSLSRTSENLYRLGLLIMLVVAGVCAGCTRRSNGGIGSGTGGSPRSSVTPAEVSSSAQVVKVAALPIPIKQGESGDAIVQLSITPGYHVNANPATYSYLIATEINAGKGEGLAAGTPTYPAATKQKFEFAEEPLAVYEGNIEIKLPLKIGSDAPTGQRSLQITVRVQACDTEKCFPPATIDSTIPVEVK